MLCQIQDTIKVFIIHSLISKCLEVHIKVGDCYDPFSHTCGNGNQTGARGSSEQPEARFFIAELYHVLRNAQEIEQTPVKVTLSRSQVIDSPSSQFSESHLYLSLPQWFRNNPLSIM